MTILDEEIVAWISVKDYLPDADTTVLVYAPGSDDPVWLGYFDTDAWFEIGGAEYDNPDELPCPVVAWATMPRGPAGDER